jgi:protein gp37
MIQTLMLDVLILDADVQPRETMASSVIKDYAKLYCEGHTFPPIVVFQHGIDYWLADGFHRVQAAKEAWLTELPADVQPGTKRDAILFSCSSNKHGKGRTNDDKRRIIERMLRDEEWRKWSDREIAEHCGVDHKSVAKRRHELGLSGEIPQIQTRNVERNGRHYEMDTSRIGGQTTTSLGSLPEPTDDGSEAWTEEAYAEEGENEPEETNIHDDLSRDDIENVFPSWPAAAPLILIPDPPPVINGQRPTFNRTNEQVDWAKWTWNPVTGCLHNCVYCYARDIAIRHYPEQFEPTFHPDRLKAPHYTKVPSEAETQIGYRNVFVCSMADLFGKWVPQEWIDAVLAEVRAAPQWNFLFLTKFPQRLAAITWPHNAWVGTTVDEQYRVEIAERAFRKIDARVKWLSCEPLREHLTFSSLEMFDWVVLGGQSKSSQAPAFQPPWEWVEHLWQQARTAGCLVYWKPNLLTRPQEYPGQRGERMHNGARG